MSYKLVYTQKAVDDINKLDTVAKKRLKKAMERFRTKPFYYAKKMVNSDLGQYRFRVGSYRIVFDVDEKIIVILRIGHRKEVYR